MEAVVVAISSTIIVSASSFQSSLIASASASALALALALALISAVAVATDKSHNLQY